MNQALPILLLSASLSFATSNAFGAEGKGLKLCSLIPSFETSKATFVKKGPYKHAFRASKSTTWKKAHRTFSKEFTKQESLVLSLFQAPEETEVTNKAIQKFLEKYVLGPHPVLLTTDDGFALRPEVAMTWLRAQCESGVEPENWRGAKGLTSEDHPRLLEAFAVQRLVIGEPRESLALLSKALTRQRPPIPLLVIASVANARIGNAKEARTWSARADELCLGPKECRQAAWLREHLDKEIHEPAP